MLSASIEEPCVEVACQSPSLVETSAGKTLVASFIAINRTPGEKALLGQIEVPSSWMTSLPDQFPFCLESAAQHIQLAAIKIPSNCPPGRYEVRYRVQQQLEASPLATAAFDVVVAPFVHIESSLGTLPKHVLAGHSYVIELHLANHGNVRVPVEIEVQDAMEYCRSIASTPIALEPNESTVVYMPVQTDVCLKNQLQHVVVVKLRTEPSESYFQSHTAVVTIFPSQCESFDPYLYLPFQTTFAAGRGNGKTQLFAEIAGAGTLDEEGEKHVELQVRLPVTSEINLVNELYGVPEKNFLHYWDRHLDAYAGDGIYVLTPLTMKYRYGRGGSFGVAWQPFEAGVLCVKDSSSMPQVATAGFLSWTPRSMWTLTTALLKTNLNRRSQYRLKQSPQTYTCSLGTYLEICRVGTLEAEFASTSGFPGRNNHYRAYYFSAEGRPFKETWYSFRTLHAGSRFVGFYTDTYQLDGSMGFPIVGRLRGHLSHHIYNTNGNKMRRKCFPSRDASSWAGVAYPFASGLYSTLSYNSVYSNGNRNGKRLADRRQKNTYRLHYLSLGMGQAFQRWSYQGIVEGGRYTALQTSLHTHHRRRWQNYQLYLYATPSSQQRYSVYTRLGYLLISDDNTVRWTQVYGVTGGWDFSTVSLRVRLLYEYTQRAGDFFRHFVSGELSYLFANGHLLQLKGLCEADQCVKGGEWGRQYKILLAYTLPWQMPVGEKPSQGGARGQVLDAEGVPLSGVLMACNGHAACTNGEGEFSFPRLTPGNYCLWIEEEPEGLMVAENMPLHLEVKQGRMAKVEIEMLRTATVAGQVVLYAFDNGREEASEEVLQQGTLNLPDTGEGAPRYVKACGWGRAKIKLSSEEGQGELYADVDGWGRFCFDRVRPGKWKLVAMPKALPPHHDLQMKEWLIDIAPGQTTAIEVKILPAKRKLHIVDTGSIATEGH